LIPVRLIRNYTQRYWEIDLLRGIAVVIMICFHFLYDLNFFGIIHLSLYSGFFFYIAYGTASLFIILFGISLTLKYQKLQSSSERLRIGSFMIRGMKIFFLGLIITLVTVLIIPDRYIIFGILHFIGISLMISYPFLRGVKQNIVLGVVIILIGWVIRQFSVDFSWGLPLGFIPIGFSTVDYFPLFPWFGVVLLGMAVGNTLYRDGKRQFHISENWMQCPVPLICLLGRQSLIIYFFHQPILFGLVYLLLH
jgi:uncharacterized membrane protein